MKKEKKKGIPGMILDALFPHSIYCISCGAVIDGSRTYSLCDRCIEKFAWCTEGTCAKCGKPLKSREDAPNGASVCEDAPEETSVCDDCAGRNNYFEKGFVCAAYGLYERMLVSDLKERGQTYIAYEMALAMADRMQEEDLGDVTAIPVPASSKHLTARGFNQAELIARYYAIETGIRLMPDVLVRTRQTAEMKKKSAFERAENVRDAFAVKQGKEDAVRGREFLLIDDVYTTGSTVNNCAKALRKSGASKVYVLAFAAGAKIYRGSEKV